MTKFVLAEVWLQDSKIGKFFGLQFFCTTEPSAYNLFVLWISVEAHQNGIQECSRINTRVNNIWKSVEWSYFLVHHISNLALFKLSQKSKRIKNPPKIAKKFQIFIFQVNEQVIHIFTFVLSKYIMINLIISIIAINTTKMIKIIDWLYLSCYNFVILILWLEK